MSEKWKVIYFYYPLGLYFLTFLGFTFFLKYDSLKYLIVKGNLDEAKESIKQIYSNTETKEKVLLCLSKL